ncbi:hypothetical protein [Halostreptopolyspora alba]|uniref:Uncharacterized protein n=1 Tax=Halostreptopolyspora alba TaxID=2487137 RepID=A0A3N0E582_9ACTN|nr:hypothetical protein EFW17_17505 [Nocardiopsaceae bacterium YIM 96095]
MERDAASPVRRARRRSPRVSDHARDGAGALFPLTAAGRSLRPLLVELYATGTRLAQARDAE